MAETTWTVGSRFTTPEVSDRTGERASQAPGAGQSRRMSLIEAITNVAVGFLVALVTQIIVFPLFSLEVSLDEHLAIGGLFTPASIARSYALRRLFEAIRVRSVTSVD
jgi:hypothetical protein